jgi:hypothetical protein
MCQNSTSRREAAPLQLSHQASSWRSGLPYCTGVASYGPGILELMAENPEQGSKGEESSGSSSSEQPAPMERVDESIVWEYRSMTLVGFQPVGDTPPDALLPPAEAAPTEPTTPSNEQSPSADAASEASQGGE